MSSDLDFNVSRSPEDIINTAGMGKLENLKPGWLYEMAMQHSGDNHYSP